MRFINFLAKLSTASISNLGQDGRSLDSVKEKATAAGLAIPTTLPLPHPPSAIRLIPMNRALMVVA